MILYRYAVTKGINTETATALDYADSDKISGYAKEAVSYAVGNGVIGGKGDNQLCPKETASRAEVATMLMRFAEVVS